METSRRDENEVAAVLRQHGLKGHFILSWARMRHLHPGRILDVGGGSIIGIVKQIVAFVSGGAPQELLAVRPLPEKVRFVADAEHLPALFAIEFFKLVTTFAVLDVGHGQPVEAVEAIVEARLLGVGCQRPGQTDDVVVLDGLARRHAEQIHGVAAAHVKQPRHQFVAEFLGVGGVVQAAQFDAPLAHALGQFAGGVLAVEADETGDRFAGLDVEPVFRIVGPLVGFTAELQRQSDVLVADGRAQPVRVIAKTEVLMAV